MRIRTPPRRAAYETAQSRGEEARGELIEITATLARTELVRAVAEGGVSAVTDARSLLDDIDIVALSRALLDDAATLPPPHLCTLDAIHLAAAQRAGRSLRAVVTYDARMADAATLLGMRVIGPA